MTVRRGLQASEGPANVRICHEGGQGQLLPLLGEFELKWPSKLKVLLYGAGLIYCFLGVSIVADMFMSAIERITSRKRVTRAPGTQRNVTQVVWNSTVANLTLMALGSSAPEILLSLNDIVKWDFHSGKLGPSTIVGSAAFNLFVIIAVCVNSVPTGEVRQIKATGVFAITAVFSIMAYVWLLFIVTFNSRNIIEVWEGVCTFMFFPILVCISYAADVGWLSKRSFAACCTWLSAVAEAGDESSSSDGRGSAAWVLDCLHSALCFFPQLLRKTWSNSEAQLDGLEPGSTEDFDPLAPILDERGQPVGTIAGVLTFKSDALELMSADESQEYIVRVYRKNGTTGRVASRFRMETLTAAPGYDYVEDSGELSFRDGVDSAEITLMILPKGFGECSDSFQVILEDATGGLEFNPYSDGGSERCLLTVTIRNGNATGSGLRARAIGFVDTLVNIKELRLGTDAWKEQIVAAVYVGGSRDEQDAASFGDWFLHCIWFPWQFLFSVFTPPPIYIGGWVCFWCSLTHIAWLTVIVGDLAELFGCAADVNDEITAISFVALGTSVPDLFASRTAAKQDEWADASIVNVTGSNSVNVFLGIGLPWMWAAFHWSYNADDAEWARRYAGTYPKGSFVVEGGDLTYSVAVFALAACSALFLIQMRRHAVGGELGGAEDAKAYSSFFLFLLWMFYLALSVWKYSSGGDDIMPQILSVLLGVLAIAFLMVVFGLLRQLLKVSKRHIGEEGFWGIFAASLVIGGRVLIFLTFQYQW